ncbi:unnamed protein product [Victoria cruziana]
MKISMNGGTANHYMRIGYVTKTPLHTACTVVNCFTSFTRIPPYELQSIGPTGEIVAEANDKDEDVLVAEFME